LKKRAVRSSAGGTDVKSYGVSSPSFVSWFFFDDDDDDDDDLVELLFLEKSILT
jgi:hypothetical protein